MKARMALRTPPCYAVPLCRGEFILMSPDRKVRSKKLEIRSRK